MQGGGHSPATHTFGLGADQVLSATVVLASGDVVTASACENPELFMAIRGGGPSSHGVVVDTTVKTYPDDAPWSAHAVALIPTGQDLAPLMRAIRDVCAAYPSLSDQGFSGYGQWSVDSPRPPPSKPATSTT